MRWAVGVLAALLPAVGAWAGHAIVFDRGVNLGDLSPIIELRSPSALFTILPEAADVYDGPGGLALNGTPSPIPVLVPGTRDGSTNLMASWFPDRSEIVYVSNRGTARRGQIWRTNPTTGEHVQLTDNLGNNLSPAVSPDSDYIVYLSTANIEDLPPPGSLDDDPEEPKWPENLEIYVMNADGSEPRRLTRNDTEERSPVFSFEGDRIFYVSLDPPDPPTLYSIPVDGEPGDETPVLDAQGEPLTGDSLSLLGDPLGDILCFKRPSGLFTLFDTFTRTASTGGTGFVRPYISQDGTEIVHVPAGNLRIADVTGANPRSLLLTGDVVFAQWRSPVGAFTPFSIRLERPNGGEIWPRGATRDIRWEATGAMEGPVRIEISHEGINPRIVVDSTPNDGVYEWTIPTDLLPDDDYVITVTLIADPTIGDTSDAPFRIALPEDCPKPGRPVIDATDGLFPDRVQVTWEPVAFATEYLVYRNRVNSPSTAALIGTTDKTRFDDFTAIGIRPNTGCYGPPEVVTEYYYWVRGINDCGVGPISEAAAGHRGRPEAVARTAADSFVLLAVAAALVAAGRLRRKRG